MKRLAPLLLAEGLGHLLQSCQLLADTALLLPRHGSQSPIECVERVELRRQLLRLALGQSQLLHQSRELVQVLNVLLLAGGERLPARLELAVRFLHRLEATAHPGLHLFQAVLNAGRCGAIRRYLLAQLAHLRQLVGEGALQEFAVAEPADAAADAHHHLAAMLRQRQTADFLPAGIALEHQPFPVEQLQLPPAEHFTAGDDYRQLACWHRRGSLNELLLGDFPQLLAVGLEAPGPTIGRDQ